MRRMYDFMNGVLHMGDVLQGMCVNKRGMVHSSRKGEIRNDGKKYMMWYDM